MSAINDAIDAYNEAMEYLIDDKWTSKTGEKHDIKAMDKRYLLNTLNFLRKNPGTIALQDSWIQRLQEEVWRRNTWYSWEWARDFLFGTVYEANDTEPTPAPKLRGHSPFKYPPPRTVTTTGSTAGSALLGGGLTSGTLSSGPGYSGLGCHTGLGASTAAGITTAEASRKQLGELYRLMSAGHAMPMATYVESWIDNATGETRYRAVEDKPEGGKNG
jgi:hypothetical protein